MPGAESNRIEKREPQVVIKYSDGRRQSNSLAKSNHEDESEKGKQAKRQ